MLANIMEVLLTSIVGIPIAIIVLRFFFRNSILHRITSLWVIDILIVDALSELGHLYPDIFADYVTLPIGITITLLLFVYISRIIRKPFSKLISQITELSEGKLSIDDISKLNTKNELNELNHAIQKLSLNLQQIVAKIDNSTSQLMLSSDQLNSAAQSLSAGAAEQSSSLEEVSSSMEEMLINIQQNSSNAETTSEIAHQASATMEEASKSTENSIQSTNNIIEKISIINDIAYQTNILALNAGVEAARAGDTGKGFGVIALEIRQLAEQSKLAADEINNISKDSVEINEKASSLLGELMPEIRHTTELVEQITAASNEQTSGAEQVNSAILQLNNISQQNAVTSEELSASSEELLRQSEELKNIISFFK